MFKRAFRTLPAILFLVWAVGVHSVDAQVITGGTKSITPDFTRVIKIQMRDAKTAGKDTIVDAEADTSINVFDFTNADLVNLYTYGNQLTANDSVMVQALVLSPFDSVISTVALDTLIGDSGLEVKNITALVNLYARIRLRLVGTVSSGSDSTEVQLGIEESYEGGV